MDKATIIKLRKEMHNLAGKERNTTLPVSIMLCSSNYRFSEAECCFIWDDNNEVVYILRPNTTQTNTLDSRVYPMNVLAVDYQNILTLSVNVDRLCLDNFLKDKVSKGLTNEETRKRYFKDMTDLFDERTYFMGEPSPTTEKRGMHPDDEIIDKDATKFL